MNNRGITLPEVLCYIVLFTMISLQISTFMIIINKYKKSENNLKYDENLFIEDLIGGINDFTYLYNESLYTTETKLYIRVYSKRKNMLLLTYRKDGSKIINGLNGKTLEPRYNTYKLIVSENYVLINNEEKNYNFILEVEQK